LKTFLNNKNIYFTVKLFQTTSLFKYHFINIENLFF
jgi:hypothetical protein